MHTSDIQSRPISRFLPLRRSLLLLAGVLLLALLTGCASQNAYREALVAEQAEDWDQAVIKYLEAVRTHPENIAYRAALMRAKIQAAQAHLRAASSSARPACLERAMIEFRKAVELDPVEPVRRGRAAQASSRSCRPLATGTRRRARSPR